MYSPTKMAAMLLVTMVTLVQCCVALTPGELQQFMARPHTEQNSAQQGTVTVTTEGATHRLVANGIPDHDTGTFPGRGNPNQIQSQSFGETFPASPTIAAQPTCLPKGPIAFTKYGVPLYNPFNKYGENAVEGDTAETFDACDGHPDMNGVYHYHQAPTCVYQGGNDEFVGVALDGFPIYGSKDLSGNTLTSADLDECHGRMESGKYRYRLTADFPYIMACFKGSPDGIRPRRLRDPDCKVITASHMSSVPPSEKTTTQTSPGHRTRALWFSSLITFGVFYILYLL